MNPKIKDMLREPEFWLMLVISLPGLLTGMAESVRACYDAILGHGITYDPSAAYAALTGLPVVGYVVFGRSHMRKGAAEGMGIMLASQGAVINATNPPAEALLELGPGESHPDAPIVPAGVQYPHEGRTAIGTASADIPAGSEVEVTGATVTPILPNPADEPGQV